MELTTGDGPTKGQTMNPTNPDERATFNITVAETGRGRVVVNGHDVSDYVTGLSLNARPGSVPVLRLDMFGEAAIEGAGIVEVVREPPPGPPVTVTVDLSGPVAAADAQAVVDALRKWNEEHQ